MMFPAPKYRAAIKPLSESDEEKMGEALNRMHRRTRQSSWSTQRS
jgi:translation elongation factor EF-G